MWCFKMSYFLLISVVTLGLWMTSLVCTKMWLSYRSYRFITKEIDDINSYDEVFFTKNHDRPLNLILHKIIALISLN
jgi:hypothetical protein